MPDREKVLKGLEHCSKGVTGCNDCVYRRDFGCRSQLAFDALALLEEQERTIEWLEHNLAITENNMNYYINGND